MDDDHGDEFGGLSAEWIEGAPQKQRDAHDQALTWALATRRQVQRVRQARLDFMVEHERTQRRGIYDEASVEPWRRMQAEIVLMFVAARQLMRGLERFDGDHRPREGLDSRRVQLLRNALEHWDRPSGWSHAELSAAGVDPKDNRWRADGSGVVGGVDDRELEEWSATVYSDIRSWDPW